MSLPALKATGSGVNRLGDIRPGYPIFNWDDLPVKEGLHNRHMVGLTAPAHILPDYSPDPT